MLLGNFLPFGMPVRRARWIGTAPGTATIQYAGPNVNMDVQSPQYPPYPPPDGGPGVPPYPTQAWYVPAPSNVDEVRIALPPNQRVTGAGEMIIKMPNAQKTMGPVPNDRQRAARENMLPMHKGWIHTGIPGEDVFTLQGLQTVKFERALGATAEQEASSARKWSIFAAVMGALASVTIATVGVLQYRRSKSEARRVWRD